MNRGRSSDSLDNCNDDVICSSSGSSTPMDFTSDDETSTENLFMFSGQPRNRPKSNKFNGGQSNQCLKNGHPRFHHNINYPPQHFMNSNKHHMPAHHHLTGFITDNAENSLGASTSLYNASISSRIQDSSSLALMNDPTLVRRCNNREIDETNVPQRTSSRDMRSAARPYRQQHRAGHSRSDFDVENGENFNIMLSNEENDSENELFGQLSSPLEPSVSAIRGPIRNTSTVASLMCAKLVECRNIIEAIEFIDLNRDLIDNLTGIITRDAPAYREYDMRNYQIDYSVKESFNPNFWLDREPVVTTADGNCQYHAVSLSLTGTETYTSEVRLATAVAVIDNRDWFDSMLKLIDRGTVLDLVHTIARSYSWGDETTLKAIAVAINRRIFLYTCNIGKKDYELVKSLSKEELLDAFKEKKYRGGTGIHAYADPLIHVPPNNYIMLFHKSEHFIAVLPTSQQPTMFEPYNPIVPVFI